MTGGSEGDGSCCDSLNSAKGKKVQRNLNLRNLIGFNTHPSFQLLNSVVKPLIPRKKTAVDRPDKKHLANYKTVVYSNAGNTILYFAKFVKGE